MRGPCIDILLLNQPIWGVLVMSIITIIIDCMVIALPIIRYLPITIHLHTIHCFSMLPFYVRICIRIEIRM